MINDIKKGSKNFNFSCFFLNSTVKKNILILYSWCRYCDDIIDNEILGFKKKKTKKKFLHIYNFILNTQKIYCNLKINEPHFNKLKAIIYKYNISPIYIFDHIEGFTMDLKNHFYETFEDTLKYCYHVAGVIGIIIVKIIIKNYNNKILDYACNLGIAFQLINISRDILSDYKNGRCYLPNCLFNKFNLNKFNFFKNKKINYLIIITKKIINQSEIFYKSSINGLLKLPIRSYFSIIIAYNIYKKISIKIIKKKKKALEKRQKINIFEKFLIVINIITKIFKNNKKNPPKIFWKRPFRN
ncbi:squalene/phytoene synthase family protein [Enterobacteriaceae bacterium ET-AT1-13]|nr:squalene/phytoene synthase family protein [Enterobacteriaceae bacterium ET-AT1-13]WGS66423.1 squalene/phytoene synthase family protein [Enterobacteriaceae bacterium Cmel17]WMC17447.1 MAG: squalene/phytoene synthase family protein [Enterobacteriaceae bacterium Cmel21]WMC18062.1 MAG: squalene/phytoene synthase family protein [Enterobacteriaceae bacterium PSmelAO1]